VGKIIVTGTGIAASPSPTYAFADFPELAFALPFENLSFERWDATLADQWAQEYSPGTGARAKYNPGFDSTRAIRISDTGIIVSGAQNGIKQTIAVPSYMLNGQKTRAGMATINSLGSPYGDSRAAIALVQPSGGPNLINYSYPGRSAAWQLWRPDSTADLNTTYTTLQLILRIASWDGATSDPAALYDCIFAEYGRTIAERYYTFARKPEFSGLDVFAETFVQSERTGRAKLRTWDATGSAVKWTVVMPFVNIPGAMVDALYEFFRRNKGLDDKEGVHLVLHHKLIDTADAYNLHIPPWLVCDIAEERWPFKYAGGFLGAKLFSGTLTFVEV
jgi:hypothetical protein